LACNAQAVGAPGPLERFHDPVIPNVERLLPAAMRVHPSRVDFDPRIRPSGRLLSRDIFPEGWTEEGGFTALTTPGRRRAL
jgi:hypothetical protein